MPIWPVSASLQQRLVWFGFVHTPSPSARLVTESVHLEELASADGLLHYVYFNPWGLTLYSI